MGRAQAVVLILLAGAGLAALTGCRPEPSAQAQGTPGPARSAFTTTTIHSTGKPNQTLLLTDDGVPAHMVQVSVLGKNDELTSWQRVESLEKAGPDDRVFTTRTREDGTVVIRFGDGKHGAVPPAGQRNIRVRYVGGGGAAGQIVIAHTDHAPAAAASTQTISEAAARALRKQAATRRYRITTMKTQKGEPTAVTTHEATGAELDASLRDLQKRHAQVGKIIAIDAAKDEPKEDDEL